MTSRSAENGKAALAEIQAMPGIKGSLSTLQLDVTSEHSISAAAKHVEAHFGRLDVLINNAGIGVKDTSLKTELETSLSTNLIGAALVTEAFTPLLLRSPNPYLLYISSGLGLLAWSADPTRFDYAYQATGYRISKAAMNMLAVEDHKKLGKQGVKVFAVCPGLVESNLRGKSEEERKAGGMAGDPEGSGRTILRIVEGERDVDVGSFVHADGVYPW